MANIDESEVQEMLKTVIEPLQQLIQSQTDKIGAMSSLIENLVESNTGLSKKLDSFLQKNDGRLNASPLTAPFSSYYEQFPSLGESGNTSVPYSQVIKGQTQDNLNRRLPESTPIHLQNRFTLFDLLDEREQMKEKKLNAVIINYPECAYDEDTVENDWEMVQEIFRNAYLPTDRIRKVMRLGWKHPRQPRLLKVFMDNELVRNKFIRAYNFQKAEPKSFCRRDLTVTELMMDGEARREAYRRNAEVGMRKWTVRDLQIVELLDPQPLFNRNTDLPPAKTRTDSSIIDSTLNSNQLEDNASKTEPLIPQISFLSKLTDKLPTIVEGDSSSVTSTKSKSGK